MGFLSIRRIVKSMLMLLLISVLVFIGNDWWQLRASKSKLKHRLQEISRRTVSMNYSQKIAESAIRKIEDSSRNLVNWALKDRKLEKLLKIHDDDILGEDNISENEYSDAKFDLVSGDLDQNVHVTIEAMEGTELRQQRTISNLQSINQTLKAGIRVASAIPTIYPVKGWISSGYGFRKSPFHGKRTRHHGADIAAAKGSQVYSTADGIVEFSGRKGGYGNLIVISHGFGIKTRYGHNGKMVVKAGDEVSKGQLISYVGMTGRTTGPHVHYEILIRDKRVNPFRFMKTFPNGESGDKKLAISRIDYEMLTSEREAPMGGGNNLSSSRVDEIMGVKLSAANSTSVLLVQIAVGTARSNCSWYCKTAIKKGLPFSE